MSVNVVSNNVIELEGSDYGFLEDVTIDEEVQEHYKIIGKEIVGTFTNILVTGDKKANRLWFTMRDTYDGEELHNKNIKIWFNTPDDYLDYDEPSEIYHSAEAQQIRFSWLLTGKHSRLPGRIKFSVEITDDSGYEWNTLEAEFVVERTINKNGDAIPPFERGWVIKCIEDSKKALELASTPLDYNQNDETASDYIKNRPFYETEALCICDYNEKTEDGRINPAVQMNEGITLVKGEHLLFEIIEDGKVKYDEIERLGIDGGDGFFYFKSGRFYSWEEGSKVITVQTWDEAYEISVKITRPGVVNKLDEKFIPDTIARKEDVNAVIGDIDTALDEILAIQSRYIEGGNL